MEPPDRGHAAEVTPTATRLYGEPPARSLSPVERKTVAPS
jgi:hypothetical protein